MIFIIHKWCMLISWPFQCNIKLKMLLFHTAEFDSLPSYLSLFLVLIFHCVLLVTFKFIWWFLLIYTCTQDKHWFSNTLGYSYPTIFSFSFLLTHTVAYYCVLISCLYLCLYIININIIFFGQDIEKDLGLTREKLIRMALLLGSDYTEGIR